VTLWTGALCTDKVELERNDDSSVLFFGANVITMFCELYEYRWCFLINFLRLLLIILLHCHLP
jgi:hypothetical protein